MIIRNPTVGEGLAGVIPFAKSAQYSFRVLPLFVAIGFLVMQVGIATSAYDAARKWVGRSPGGLATATIFASVGFAVVSEAATASTAVFTRMAPAEMEKRGYARVFSAGDSTPVVKLNAKQAPCVAPPIMEKIVALRKFGRGLLDTVQTTAMTFMVIWGAQHDAVRPGADLVATRQVVGFESV
nr:TRAP transporter large permease subunit [Phaeovulum sp. NW3]